MSKLLKIPAHEPEVQQIPKKDGTGTWPKTVFRATDQQGNPMYPCEAFGDRVAVLKKYMESGETLEVENWEYREKYDCYHVTFLGGGFGSKPSGGNGFAPKKTWPAKPAAPATGGWKSPNAYGGKQIPKDIYLTQVIGAFRLCFDEIMKSARLQVDAQGNPPPLGILVPSAIEAASKLAAQFAIEVEHNVTFIDGFLQGQSGVSAPPAVSDGVSESRPGGNDSDTLPGESAAFTYLADLIFRASPPNVALDQELAKNLQMQINANEEVSRAEKSKLLIQIYEKTQVGKPWAKVN